MEAATQSGVDILLALEVANAHTSPHTPTSDSGVSDGEFEVSMNNPVTKNKRRKKIKKNKKNKPKKAMTPFMVFSKETRKLLVSENPGMTFSEIGKELGARWRALNEKDKEIFVIKANEDYQRFLDETEQLEALNPSRKRKTVEQKRQTKVKKSISAYLYFCNAHREQVKAMHPEMKMVEIQRLLADKWMNSPQCIKIPFEKQAAADRDKYNADLVHEDEHNLFTTEGFFMEEGFNKVKLEDTSLYQMEEQRDLSFLNFSNNDRTFDSLRRLSSCFKSTELDSTFLNSDFVSCTMDGEMELF